MSKKENEITEVPVQKSYFEERCLSLGLTPENNKLSVVRHAAMKDSPVDEFPLLAEDKKTGDILIPLYDIKGAPCTYYKDNSGKLQSGKEKFIEVRRYHPDAYNRMCEIAEKEGKNKPGKYQNPKGAKTLPWISPNIIEANKAGTAIDTIIITEGYIKAISGYLNGLYIFGLSGIQNIKDRDTATLHPDILACIKNCKIKNIILLYDGDCKNISQTALQEGKDLYQRPYGFFASAKNTIELLKDHRKENEFDVYFAHVNTDNLDGKPKGLDDVYETYREEFSDITKELTSYSRTKSHYFQKFNITHSLSKVYQHLHITNAETFHTHHQQAIGTKPFVFNGTKYQYDEEKLEVKILIPGAAKNYFRVGDNYYEKLHVPNKNGLLEYQYHRRQASTITADNGKYFLPHVPKYKAFCTKPDHQNYQEIISSCFNRYKPFEHEASDSESDCPEILEFLGHIFGEQIEMGLDYIQLLYQRPTQALHILCLVSDDNNTGKSTFVKLLKAIFTGNMAIISNSDLESDFNGGWADKLIIACEESFIDKKKTIEKIKALATGDKIQINMKGIDQIEIDFFGKFIFCSNNENNFIIANEKDERYWVRRVPKFKKERVNLLSLMMDEIPNFLFYLNKRTLANECKGRMWFSSDLIQTDALKKLVTANTSAVEREVRQFIRNMMLDHGFLTLQYTLGYLKEKVIRGKYENYYVARILTEKMKIQGSRTSIRFKYPVIVNEFANDVQNEELRLWSGLGKPYTFEAKDFLTPEEISTVQLCPQAKSIGQEELLLDFSSAGVDKDQDKDLPF